MNDNDIYLTSREVLYVARQIDKNHDGKITYSDFKKEILPKESFALRAIA